MTLIDGTLIPLRHGLRAWFYRGQRRAGRHRIGHQAIGLVLFTASYLR